ncbi:MAG TPA: HEAT repeat domain-containing protein [Pirellulales bacterium]|nr:HEAT repeat domain-containing protein [Pirellulales bacterium]
MPRSYCAVWLAGCIVALVASTTAAADKLSDSPQLVAPTEAISAAEQQKKFRLPPGFSIQLVAAEPEIRKPMNLNFDVHGRLYATQSEEYPFPAKEGEPRRDVIKRFDNIGADGRPANVVTVVQGLNIPIGLLPREDALIYYNIPEIYRAADPQHDGHYQPGQPIYSSFGFRDTHGMASSFTRWLDGWVYACHGFSNDSNVKGADGKAVKMNSGNTYRFRPDGSHIEQFTHGQVNPFGLAMDPLGNLYSSDCHTKPIYMLLRGAWYPSFGKPHDGLGYGPEMIEHFHGSTGIAGVVYYTADHFPAEYRDTVFIGNPVTGKINHDRFEQHGSSYKAIEQPDFIACDDPWFRPVDIKLGPDGALYIADFYNCIIGHYEVPLTHPRRDRSLGRIWRVVYTGTEKTPAAPPRSMPDLTGLRAEQLMDLLGDPNLTVRVLASERLTTLLGTGESVATSHRDLLKAAIGSTATDDAIAARRAHALWLAERALADGLPRDAVERLANDPSRLVRVHLVKALAERDDWSRSGDWFALVREKLKDTDPFVRRAAADALGRHPAAENVEPLLALWAETPGDDTHLIHTVRMALRDQLLLPGSYGSLAALVAAKPEYAARLADVSLGVRNGESAAYLLSFAETHALDDGPLAEYLHDAVRYTTDEQFADAMRRAQAVAAGSYSRQQSSLLSLARAAQERAKPVPAFTSDWAARVATVLLAQSDRPSVDRGIELARQLHVAPAFDALAVLAGRESKLPEARGAALDGCVAIDGGRALPIARTILTDAAEGMPMRQKAATVLAAMNLPDGRAALAEQLKAAPDRLAIEIARGLAGTADGGEALLAEVAAGRCSPRLLKDAAVEQKLAAAKLPELNDRLAKLTADLPPADARLAELVDARRAGFGKAQVDAVAGRQVFTKICAACHQLGGQGAKIGPGLDGVGLRGLDRLLEDTLDPSRNVDQAFRTTLINTTGGNVISGLLLREEGEVLVLADAQGKEIRLPRGEVEERSLSKLSPMPANVVDLIPEADYYNLLGFLLEQKQKTETASSN